MAKQQKPRKTRRTDKRKLFTAILALVMVAALVLPLLSGLLTLGMASESDLKSQISSLKGDATQATARRKELEEQLKAIEQDKAKAMERKNILDQQLSSLDSQIANTQSQIDTYNALIEQTGLQLEEAQTRESEAYDRFLTRARAMEEAGEISYLSILFQANSYVDLLDRLAMVDEIVTYDNTVVETLAAARTEVETTLADLNEAKTGLDEQKAALDAQRAEQAEKVAQAEAVLTELKGQAAHAEALVAAEEAEEKRINAAIAKKQKELDQLIASKQIQFDPGTGWYYPLPKGNVSVTSLFGWRTHPLTGKPNNHSGTDIAAAGGTPVYAARGGVVQTSAYAPSSYGEYVVINHGDGYVTLYAHMQRGSRTVKEGDIVKQGQTLGKVGMTGSASGNHLHLELRINGVRQDARTLYPSIQFKYPYGTNNP